MTDLMTTVAAIPETRCIHEMLEFHTAEGRKCSCSICSGLPYMVGSPLAEFEPVLASDEPAVRAQWLPLEERTECAACEKRLDRGHLATWSQRHEGPVGTCCKEEIC
jgi:hypothetical protein